MLTTEMAKPRQLVKVSTLPTTGAGALRAVSAENCGESPATVQPHTSSQATNRGAGACSIQGEQATRAAGRQLPLGDAGAAEAARQQAAATQPSAPAAMVQNASALTARPCQRTATITGTSAYSVYSSHMCPK